MASITLLPGETVILSNAKLDRPEGQLRAVDDLDQTATELVLEIDASKSPGVLSPYQERGPDGYMRPIWLNPRIIKQENGEYSVAAVKNGVERIL